MKSHLHTRLWIEMHYNLCGNILEDTGSSGRTSVIYEGQIEGDAHRHPRLETMRLAR